MPVLMYLFVNVWPRLMVKYHCNAGGDAVYDTAKLSCCFQKINAVIRCEALFKKCRAEYWRM